MMHATNNIPNVKFSYKVIMIMLYFSYARAVAKAPYVFIIVDVLLAMALGPLTAYYHGIPDFSDPLSVGIISNFIELF